MLTTSLSWAASQSPSSQSFFAAWSASVSLSSGTAVPVVVALVPRGAWSAVAPPAWTLLALGSIGPGAIAGLVFVWGLRRVPAAHASALTLLEPFVAVMIGIAVFGEALTLAGAVGGILVLAGAALVVLKR